MKNKKLLLSSILVLPLLLTGCKNESSGAVEIEFDEIIPTAYIGEEYDFSEVLIVEKDVEYKLEVYYFDYYEKVEKSLEVVNQYCFTPKELFDVTVVVNAKKGSSTQVRSRAVPVAQKIDPIDELLATDGFSGWGDPGIQKEAVVDDQYFKGENSHSALSVHFQGSNPYTWGTTFLSLNNFRLLPYWEDQTWENAVVHFWVYNPSDYPLEFQMRVYDKLTDLVNVDWGQALNVPQFAAPNDWTEINFSLKHLGVNHTLYQNEEGTRDDSIIVKVKYGNTPEGGMEVYSYQFFVDDINVVPYSEERFPDLDTTCYATAEDLRYGWENMLFDDGWQRANVLYDREFVNSSEERTSLSSLFLTFDGVRLKDGDEANGYCVILNPQAEFGDDDLPSFRHGTLDFDIHFSSDITDKRIQIAGVQIEWHIFGRVITNPVAGTGDWMHVSFDFGEHSGFYNITQGIRLCICFPGIDTSNKDTAVVHLDNITFKQNGGIPEDEIEVIRGVAFAPGYSVDFSAVALTETMVIDIKFTSGSDTLINFIVGDGWENYYGYYALHADGRLDGEYSGISVRALDDGYYRMSLVLSELNTGQATSGITKINLFYLHGSYTTATGYIDFINPVLY